MSQKHVIKNKIKQDNLLYHTFYIHMLIRTWYDIIKLPCEVIGAQFKPYTLFNIISLNIKHRVSKIFT